MCLMPRAAVGNGRRVIGKLDGGKQVVGLPDGRLHRVAGVPSAAVRLAVGNACKHARRLGNFHAGFLPEPESCAIFVHFVDAEQSARFIKIDVAGLV